MGNDGWDAAEEMRLEREEERQEALADAEVMPVHARPEYDYRTDTSTFPCGLPGNASVLVSWHGIDGITCPGCLLAESRRLAKEQADAVQRKAHYEALPSPCVQPCSCARCQEETVGAFVASLKLTPVRR